MTEYELIYPTPNGKISDRSLAYHVNDPDRFRILTYWGYSSGTGEFWAIESTWRFVETNNKIRLHLEQVATKHPYSNWRSDFTNPASLLSDIHLRLAREQYRIRSKNQRCKALVLNPSTEYHELSEE